MAIRVLPHNPELSGLIDLCPEIPFTVRGEETLCLQMLRPRWSAGNQGFPLVVFIQGSGWTKPNQFWQLPQLSQLAARGFVIASVTHRSCVTSPAPAFLQDVKTAVRFLRAHAAEYQIDKSRVCAFGTSSGGNTALLLGLTGDDPAFRTAEYPEESDAVRAVVDCFGPTNLVKMSGGKTLLEIFDALGAHDPARYGDLLGQISPVNYVQPGRMLPPFLILHGDADELVPYEESEQFYHQLVESGYAADFVHVTDAPHEGSFWSQALLDVIFEFIQANV